MNGWDPSGMSRGAFEPLCQFVEAPTTSSVQQSEGSGRKATLLFPSQLNTLGGKAYSCNVSSSDFTHRSIHASLPAWVEVSLLTIAISTTSGIIVTMQSEISITGISN